MTATTTIKQVDIAKIAKEIRNEVKFIHGAVFSVRINRQWARVKDDPHSVIWIQGGYATGLGWEHTKASRMEMQTLINSTVEKYGLKYNGESMFDTHVLIQKH